MPEYRRSNGRNRYHPNWNMHPWEANPLLMPWHQSPPAPVRGAPQGAILVADDDDAVLGLHRAVLVRAGYDVIVARDGMEAVARYTAASAEIALVILDLNMPRMDGAEAFARIRETNPRAAVLLCSGAGAHTVEQQLERDGLMGLLQKPFGPGALLAKVWETLRCAEAEAAIEIGLDGRWRPMPTGAPAPEPS